MQINEKDLQNIIKQAEDVGFYQTDMGYSLQTTQDKKREIKPLNPAICMKRVQKLTKFYENNSDNYKNNNKTTTPKPLCIKGLGGGQRFLTTRKIPKIKKSSDISIFSKKFKIKMPIYSDNSKVSELSQFQNPLISRDFSRGQTCVWEYPYTTSTPPSLGIEVDESGRPVLSKLSTFETVRSVQSNKPSLLIGFDSEWVGEPRHILSWQFSVVVKDELWEYVFIRVDKLLSLSSALSKIFDDIGLKSFDSRDYQYFEACVGFKSAKEPIWKRFDNRDELLASYERIYALRRNDNGEWEPGSKTIDKLGDERFLDDKSRSWRWTRRRFEYPSVHNVCLVCHTGKVDLTTLDKSDDFDDYLRFVSEIQGGTISLTPIRRSFKSYKPGVTSNSFVYPVSLSFRDTMGQAPSSGKSLDALGKAIGIAKLDDERIDKADMLKTLLTYPSLYMNYASRDSTLTVLYASALYGYNREMAVTLTSASAKAARTSMKQYLGVNSDEDFDRVYRGIKKVRKGFVKDPLSPRFLQATNKEAITEEVRDILTYASLAYHGGLNQSIEIGWFEGLTNDFDLQNAYPTAMAMVPDIDWENPVMSELTRVDITFNHFRDRGGFNPMTPMFGRFTFEFPKDVKHPSIPVNVDGRLIFPRTSEGLDVVYACGPEVFLALKLGAKVWCERGWVLAPRFLEDGRTSYSLGFALKRMITDRNEAKELYGKKSFEQDFFKVLVNSVYGKNAQNVVNKSTWDAYHQEMVKLGDSAITNPVSAALITSYVRALLLATMNEAEGKGYHVYSVTTDGFIADIPSVELLESFELYGFVPLTRMSRDFLTDGKDLSIWEIKHSQTQLLNLTTRGNMAPNVGGVCAHNSTKTPYPSGSVEDRKWFIRKGLERVMGVVYNDMQWTTFKELTKGGLFKTVPVERKVSMDFDMKRKPVRDSFKNVTVDFDGSTFVIANFETEAYENVEEAHLYEKKKKTCEVLRTLEHWESFWFKLDTNTSGCRSASDWDKLLSCVRGARMGKWVIDELCNSDMSVAEKCAWINSLKLCDKEFKRDNWKNACRKDRKESILPLSMIIDFLEIMGAYDIQE